METCTVCNQRLTYWDTFIPVYRTSGEYDLWSPVVVGYAHTRHLVNSDYS